MKYYVLTTALLMLIPLAQAQERTASGAISEQVTWSSLSAQISAVNSRTEAVNSRIDQLVVCARKGMIYAPGSGDAQGCLEASQGGVTNKNISFVLTSLGGINTSITNLNNSINGVNGTATAAYNLANAAYNRAPSAPNCRLASSAGNGSCPAGQATIQSEGTCHTGSGGRGGYDTACTVTTCVQVICQ